VTRYDVGCNLVSSSGGSGTVNTSGCISGDGSSGDPIILNIDPLGNIICGPSGLAVSGISNVVNVSGCLSGDGSVGSPLFIMLDPDGNITCGVSGLIATLSISGGSLLETEVAASLNPSGWPGASGTQAIIYDDNSNNFYGIVSGDGITSYPIHRTSCYTIDNSGGGLSPASFADAEDPTDTEPLIYLATQSITVKWGDMVKYQSPDGQEVVWDACAPEGDQTSAILSKRYHPCGLNELGSVTSIDFTTGFKNKWIVIPTGTATAITLTATEKCWYTLQISNSGTGTITWPGDVLWSGTPPQPTVGAFAISVFQFWYDGSDFHGRQ